MTSCAELVRLIGSDAYETAGPFRKAQIKLQLLRCRLLCRPPNCVSYRQYLQKLGSAARGAISAGAESDLQAAEKRVIEGLSRNPRKP